MIDPSLTECPCEHCNGRPPIALSYHDLMKHSVACRAAEIREWTPLDTSDAAGQLADEYQRLLFRIRERRSSPTDSVARCSQHRASARLGYRADSALNWETATPDGAAMTAVRGGLAEILHRSEERARRSAWWTRLPPHWAIALGEPEVG